MKKGFTIIELLAVIIILAILALIVSPIITNVIIDSKAEAAKISITNVVSYLKDKCTLIEDQNLDITYNFESNSVEPYIQLRGSLPNGSVTIKNKCNMEIKLYKNNTCAYKSLADRNIIYATFIDGECSDLDNIYFNINKTCALNATNINNTCVCDNGYYGDGNTSCLSCYTYEKKNWESFYRITNYNEGCASSVEVPNTYIIDDKEYDVKRIEKSAFYNKNIDSIKLNSNLIFIDMYALRGNNLKTITIPSSVQEIVLDAFRNNKLESVIFEGIPNKIGNSIFAENPDLKKVCVPTGKIEKFKTLLVNAMLPNDVSYYDNVEACK